MKIPFIGGSDQGRSLNWNASRTVNFFPEIGTDGGKAPVALIGTPGTKLFTEFSDDSPPRMLHSVGGRCFTVIGSSLYEVYRDGTISSLLGEFNSASGAVEAVNNGISSAGVGGDQIFMVTASEGYIFNLTDNTLIQITDPNFPSYPKQVAYLDGYFIVSADDMTFNVSELYNGLVWPPLAFAAATSTSDAIKKPIGLNQMLYLIKESATEIWQDVAIPTSQGCPFDRVQGLVVDFGTTAPRSVTRCGDMITFLATTRTLHSSSYYGVVAMSGSSVQKVSTQAIDYRISQLTRIDLASAYSYVDEGHLFYVITFPKDDLTLVYDLTTQMWHERSTYAPNKRAEQHRHLSEHYIHFADKHLVSHYKESKIYEMSSRYYDDDGLPIVSIRTAQPIYSDRELDNMKISKLIIDIEGGVGDGSTPESANIWYANGDHFADFTGYAGDNVGIAGTSWAHNGDPMAWLSWSNDGGHTWSDDYPAAMGKQGDYRRRLIWRRLGAPRNRIFKLKMADSVKKVVLDARVNDGVV